MRYTVSFICFNNDKANIKHETNDYDQAEHFFWAMILKLNKAHNDIDVNSWQLTLHINNENEQPNYKYHFSKT